MRTKVTKLIEQALEENESLFLIDLSISEGNKIRVILDGDMGVSVEDCIGVSRAIENNLDREEEDFSLEVMSSGVSESLTMPRQFKKNIGRTLKVKVKEGSEVEGVISEADEKAVTLKWKTREPKPIGKGKVTVQKEAILPYVDIVEAKVMVKFN